MASEFMNILVRKITGEAEEPVSNLVQGAKAIIVVNVASQ